MFSFAILHTRLERLENGKCGARVIRTLELTGLATRMVSRTLQKQRVRP